MIKKTYPSREHLRLLPKYAHNVWCKQFLLSWEATRIQIYMKICGEKREDENLGLGLEFEFFLQRNKKVQLTPRLKMQQLVLLTFHRLWLLTLDFKESPTLSLTTKQEAPLIDLYLADSVIYINTNFMCRWIRHKTWTFPPTLIAPSSTRLVTMLTWGNS